MCEQANVLPPAGIELAKASTALSQDKLPAVPARPPPKPDATPTVSTEAIEVKRAPVKRNMEDAAAHPPKQKGP